MNFTPHNYQQQAIDFIKTHPVSALFLDMGLGKTAITLTAIQDLIAQGDVKRVLIVAPLRVARDTWKDEIEKWELNLSYAIAVGSPRERIDALNTKADVYIINRENVQWLVECKDVPHAYDMLVIDELSSFKNHQTKRFKAIMKIRAFAKRIVGLTGTPSSNGLMDLFAEFKLLDMGKRLGRFITTYRFEYFEPDKRYGEIVYSYKPKANAEERIYKKIADITISMKGVLEMPELIVCDVPVNMSKSERDLYTSLKKTQVLRYSTGQRIDIVTASNAAVLSGKLSQMANGAVYTDDGSIKVIHNSKLEALLDIIESMNGKPLLVAYSFKHDKERISTMLTKAGVRFEEIKTSDSIARWNRGETTVGLIHPISAGHGLNLQAGGSHLVWFGLTWSLELYEQTNARLYRQGQKDTVVIQHIITKGTIDERIAKALKEKEKTQSALIDAVKMEVI